ncbi:MAG TPA: hypothetical protein PLD81_09210, partial [Elusimicrobiales bacterium]|nr:hypothetical protein [Elusimicrobiales bacterium]
NKFQIKVTTGLNQTGSLIMDWTDVITNINQPNYNANWQIPNEVFDLMQNGTNYVSVRVYDNAGNVFVSTDVFYVRKDVQPPSITDNQSGDNLWRGVNNGYYDVDFNDNGPSGLNKFQIKVTTGLNQTGSLIVDWTDVITNINQPNYTSNWQVPNSVFNLMQNGTNYVSVRVYDNAGNVFISSDVFYVLKDTMPALVINNQLGDDIWISSNSRVYSIFFEDNFSLLNKFQIKATTGPNQTGLVLVNWTDLVSDINLSSYDFSWGISENIWNLLSNGTNYISVRVYDNAGNIFISTDVFYIRKDTIPPNTVSNLNGNTGDEGSVNITFSAPFDSDGSNVVSYIVKYATFAINLSNFDNAITYSQSWVPSPGGSLETKVISGLEPNINYYFAIKSIDKAGNISSISNVIQVFSGQDNTPPAAITDLNAYPGPYKGSIVLEFTSVGDNGYEGAASYYKVRWRTDTPITSVSLWNSATEYAQGWIPQPSGNAESFILSGFEQGTTYYMAVRVLDEVLNISLISNSTFTYASYFPARDGMILYQNGTGNVPLYSVYLATAGSFQSPIGVPPTNGGTGATVRHIIVRASPLRKEMMAGILSSDGVLQIMRYDISSNQWTKEWSTTTITATNSAYRGFDIAYESLSGRCMVLYNGSTTGSLLYNMYDGNNWSGGITLTTGTTQAVAWVRLEPNPKTNEIMAIFSKLTSLELYATKWNGDIWTDGFQLRNAVGVTTMQDFDLAWNNTGTKLLAVFGAGNTGYAQTRIYSNGVWSTGPNFTLQGANGTIRYIVAKGDLNSKYIGVTSFDTGADWN